MLLLLGATIALFGMAACEPTPTCGTNWVGPANGDFGTSANWSTGIVPTAATHACSGPGSSIVASGTQHVGSIAFGGSLTVASGASLTVDSVTAPTGSSVVDLTVEGTLAGTGPLLATGNANFAGATVEGSGAINLASSPLATITNTMFYGTRSVTLGDGASLMGTVTLCDSVNVRVTNGTAGLGDLSTVTDAGCSSTGPASIGTGPFGTLRNNGNATVNGALLVNEGTLTVHDGILSVEQLQQVSGRTEVGGIGGIASAGSPGTGTFALSGGELVGEGVVDLQVTGAGRIAPGLSTVTNGETLTLASWTAASGAVLALDIDTVNGHGYDTLQVTGTANLTTAEVTVDVYPGGGIAKGVAYPMVAAGIRSGTFSSVTLDNDAGVNWSSAYGGYTGSGYAVAADDCLPGAFGSGIDRTGANLAGQKLKQCGMAGTILRDTNLDGADLDGANLTDADLTGASAVAASFSTTVWSNTVCPDGLNSNTVGNTCNGHLVAPKTFLVTTTADSTDVSPGNGICATAGGQCSLRAAVQEANAWLSAVPDTIELTAAATYPLSVNGGENLAAAGDLDINGPLTINGHGANIANAGLTDRLVEVSVGPFTVNDVTISGATAANDGGAIYFRNDIRANVTNVTLSGNTTTAAGGAIYLADSGALPGSQVTITNSTLSGNSSANGGAILSGSNNTLVINGSTLSGNTTTGWGGGVFAQQSVAISHSAVTGNTAGGSGGGVYVATGNLAMDNTTVSGNAGLDGGGVRLWDNVTASLLHVTISANTGTTAGFFANATASVAFTNTIIASQTSGPDCNPGFVHNVTGGQNVESATSCAFTGAANRQNTNPMLKPLANNGGLTKTHLPWADSPIIGLVPNGTAGCGGANTDQRGNARPQGSACESGAVEWVPGETTAIDCTVGTTGAGSQRQYCNFTGVNFYGRHLQGANFTGTNFTNGLLSETRLAGTIFTDAKVSGAYFDWAYNFNDAIGFASTKARGWDELTISGQTLPNFSGIDLTGVNMVGLEIYYGNLTGATFGGNVGVADFTYSDLTNATFPGAILNGTRFFNTDLTGANFTGATLTGASFGGSLTSVNEAIGVAGTRVNGWQGTCFCGGSGLVDLTNLDLSGMDFTATQFSGADLSGADLAGATLTNGGISRAVGTDLTGVAATGTYFSADMTDALLVNANLTAATFSYTTLTNADFLNATVTGARFTDGGSPTLALNFRSTAANSWAGIDFRGSNVSLTNTDLTGVNMTGARFGIEPQSQSVDLSGSNLTGANLTGATITRLKLVNATGLNTVTGLFTTSGTWDGVDVTGTALNASGQNLAGFRFYDAQLTGANFTNANLANTYWNGAKVTGANFTGTGVGQNGFVGTGANSWAGTNFSGGALNATSQNLSNINMTGANLSGCYLQNAVFTGVNLTGATITGASFVGASNLNLATGLASTAVNSWANVNFTQNSLNFAGVDFTGTNMSGINLGNESVSQAVNFTGGNLTGVNFTGAMIGRANFTNVTGLTGAQLLTATNNWYGVNLTGASINLSGANLQGWNLAGMVMGNTNLSNANLTGVLAYGTNWSGVNFTNATITGASLGSGTGFAGATGFVTTNANGWAGTFLTGGDFTNVDFTGISMSGAYWVGSTFNGANFTNANLGGVGSLGTSTFVGATWSNSICPDMTNSSANGGTCNGHTALTRMAVGKDGVMRLSANGVDWVSWNSGTTRQLNGATKGQTQSGIYGSPLLVAVGENGTVTYSDANYLLFNVRTYGSANLKAVAYNGLQYVIVGNGGTIYSTYFLSSSGPARASGTVSDLYGVTWTGSKWVAVGAAGTVVTSTDGFTWIVQSSGTTAALRAVTWTGTRLVAVGDTGVVRTSTDGITWAGQTSGTTQTMFGITWTGSQVVAAGTTGRIITSPDGITWTLQTSGVTATFRGVAMSGSQILAVNDVTGSVARSTDGITWSIVYLGAVDFRAVASL